MYVCEHVRSVGCEKHETKPQSESERPERSCQRYCGQFMAAKVMKGNLDFKQSASQRQPFLIKCLCHLQVVPEMKCQYVSRLGC